ncbi:MAG: molybdate ABC transporter substrate-binding protein [Acidiferrobacterales bacterium]
MKRYSTFISVLLTCGAMLLSAAAKAEAPTHVTIRVFASDATEKPVRQIGYIFEKEHPNAKLHYEFSASGIFYIAIVQGVPPDIYISAGNEYQDKLTDKASIGLSRTIAYDSLSAAAPCYNPVQDGPKAGLTESNVLRLMTDKNTRLAVAKPTLSPAGRYTAKMFGMINRRDRDALPALAHARKVLTPTQILPLLARKKADLGIVYTSQIAAMKRQAACVNAVTIPKPYNMRIPFTISVLNKSPFHFVSPERRNLDEAFQRLVLSREGQAVLKQWGFVPAR